MLYYLFLYFKRSQTMKKFYFKKYLLAFGLFLFLTMFFPTAFLNPRIIVKAAQTTSEQSDIKLNVKSKALVKDTSYSLKIYNMLEEYSAAFKSENTAIATVDDMGLITAIDFGTTIIKVTIKDSQKAISTLECEITVGPAAISIKLTKPEIILTLGTKKNLTTILKPLNTVEEARFFSYEPTIVSVSAGGRISAKAVGSTYIFTTISNGKYDVCKVTVTEEALQEETTAVTN